MSEIDAAVLALHYQNDVLHPEGKIRVGLDADGAERQRLLRGAADLLDGARSHGLPIVHVRIAFRPDYADLLPNCDIFRNVASIGAVAEGQWGSAFYDGLQPLGDGAGHPRDVPPDRRGHAQAGEAGGAPGEHRPRAVGRLGSSGRRWLGC